ncbi:TraB/GumN family protein [Methyloversatilis thermotolerans]|uniref:TraB/GumN family protein n=1 Tax=Methyloversatilis thermotolerans TaxID=1346290 RepID=UPI0003724857|nr:TraB/GumN family protein [Methyloversatilis thermotolerans]
MRRLLFSLACAVCAALPPGALHAADFERGVLWTVRCGDAPVNHLFGTLHIGDPRVLARAEPLRPLIAQARVFMPELNLDAGAVALYASASSYEREELPRKVGRAKWARIEKALALHGVDARVGARLRPWAALILLYQPMQSRGPTLDETLIRFAQTQRVPVRALEQMQEQIDAIALLPEATLLDLLIDAARRHDRLQAGNEPMVQAWLAGDLPALARINSDLMREAPDMRAQAQALIDALLTRRNPRFVERLLPELREGGVFSAFGASHLNGPDGVLARLSAQGCSASPGP